MTVVCTKDSIRSAMKPCTVFATELDGPLPVADRIAVDELLAPLRKGASDGCSGSRPRAAGNRPLPFARCASDGRFAPTRGSLTV